MNHPPLLLLYGIDEHTLAVDAAAARQTIQRAQAVLGSRGWRVAVREVATDLPSALAPFPPDEWVVFNLCEGSPAQPFYYARAAQELEQRGYAYTGSSAQALDQTQFKAKMKELLEAGDLPTPRWQAVERAEELSFARFPAIVKPAGEHCSFGITRESVVTTPAAARAQAAAVIRQYGGGAIIEEFLDSEEYSVSLCGEADALEVLATSVIHYDAFADICDRLCTFEAKWLPETEAFQKTLPTCPAPVSARRQAELASLAQRAHVACGLRDYSRIDLRLQAGRPMVLDVNANCDLEEAGGFANAARVAGWDYATLLDRLARMAVQRPTRPATGRLVETAPCSR